MSIGIYIEKILHLAISKIARYLIKFHIFKSFKLSDKGGSKLDEIPKMYLTLPNNSNSN